MTTEVPNGVQITLGQMYGELQATHGEVIGMRSDVRSVLDTVRDHEARLRGLERAVPDVQRRADELGADVADHDTRVRSLERRVVFATGAAAAVGAVSTLVGSEIVKNLFGM